MNRILSLLLLLALLAAPPLRAEEAAAAASGGDGAEALDDPDVYYAPDDEAAEPLSPTAQSPGSFVSRASIQAYDVADGRVLEGADLFLQGAFIGRSTLDLGGRVIDKPVVELDARLADCEDASRPAVALPAEGTVRIAMVSRRSARWYTAPGWAIGLGLLAAAAVVYDSHNTGPGLALVGGGVATIGLSQIMARLVHLPGLRRRAEALNARREPAPDPGSLP